MTRIYNSPERQILTNSGLHTVLLETYLYVCVLSVYLYGGRMSVLGRTEEGLVRRLVRGASSVAVGLKEL